MRTTLAREPRPPVLLVVDGDQDNADSLAQFFEHEIRGARAYPATTVRAAQSVLARQDVDLVVADYRISGQSGIDFLEQVRADNPGVRTVLITSYAPTDVLEAAVERAQVDGLFLKPLDPQEFANTCRRMVTDGDRRASPTLRRKALKQIGTN